MTIREELEHEYKRISSSIYGTTANGYWSNLSQTENSTLLESMNEMTSKEAILKLYPELYEVIFSSKRAGGLELLNLQGNEAVIDYGCMWGALTVPVASRCQYVLGIDQTLESLLFLDKRLKEQDIENVDLLQADLKALPSFKEKFDAAIVNGVLEWIPEEGIIELKSYYGQYSAKSIASNPKEQQMAFLQAVNNNLKDSGKLYLAIENRYDFKMFFGVKDPHANLPFTTILPRSLANVISQIKLGRPYVNWIYSFRELEKILRQSGFSSVCLYMCFPGYHFPDRIILFEGGLSRDFVPTISNRNSQGALSYKRIAGRILEYIVFKWFRLRNLAPSIIAVATK